MINKELKKTINHRDEEFEIDTDKALLIETLKELINVIRNK